MLLASSAMLWQSFRLSKAAVQAAVPAQLKQLELLDKVTTMLASRDVLSYQGIQAMNPQPDMIGGDYDPSDEAAFAREHERYGKDWVSDEDDADALFNAFG